MKVLQGGRPWAALMFSTAAIAAVGCGGGGSGGSSSVGSGSGSGGTPSEAREIAPGGAKIGGGKPGGDITMLASGDIDYLDPGQSYYQFGYQVANAVNRTLYTYKPGEPDKPVADLATGDPEISSDSKTITIKIRKGVKYAPPVNREVTTKDIKYAMERAFTSNVPNGYATSYFSEIEGAPTTPPKIQDMKGISGIQTPDDQTLVLKLTKPVAARVAAALVLPISTPVPQEYAEKFDRKTPSTYDQYVAFVGPYMVKNDPKTGKVTGRTPGKRIEMVRNPNWDKSTDFRPAYLNSITIEEGNSEETVAARRTLNGKGLICCDSSKPPATILRQAITRMPDQIGRIASGGQHWNSLNTTKKPLDNLNVRKAIIAATDREAIRQVAGGKFIGPIAQSYFVEGIPGFEESGGDAGFKEFDWMQHPTGDAATAKKYMLAAKEDGVPVDANGKYTGGEKLQIAVNNTPDGQKEAEIQQDAFRAVGIDVDIRQVTQDTLYSKFCGVPKNEPAMCAGIGWVKDFGDAESMVAPTFNSKAIKPAGNVNWSQLRSKNVDSLMDKAINAKEGPERNQLWADVNKAIVAEAPAVLTTADDNFSIQSSDVAGIMNPISSSWDFAFTYMR